MMRSSQDSLFSSLVQASDQLLMRIRQSCHQFLGRIDRLKRHIHEEVQDVRGFMDLLDDYQSDITMENSEGCDSTVNVSTPKLDSMAPML